MKKQQLKFWTPYISLIGKDNFLTDGIDIKTKLYCGVDFSLGDGTDVYISSMLNRILYKHKKYTEATRNSTLTYNELSFIFNSLIEKPFLDVELLHLMEKKELDITDEEYWKLVIDMWNRQEFNSDSDRKSRWRKIFAVRDKIPSLTKELPNTFIAYRAGELDGFSWTLNKEVAEWFYNRFKTEFGVIPFNENTFSKSDAVFYTNDRDEQEVVIIPLIND